MEDKAESAGIELRGLASAPSRDKSGGAAAQAQPEREEGAGAPNWDVLKDDYGMEHTKLKHWDEWAEGRDEKTTRTLIFLK